MKPVTFSIVVATKGRDSLAATLASVAPQLEAGDEVLVVRSEHPWGHQARNEAIPRCAGTHLLFIDDDDRHMKGALELVREHVGQAPGKVHIFAMAYSNGSVVAPVWPLRVGTVGTPMFCVPNKPGRLGVWSERHEGDFDFIASTMELRKDKAVLHEDVIALIRA